MLESLVEGGHMVLRAGGRTTARSGGGHLIIRDEGRLRVRSGGGHLIIRGHRRAGASAGILWQLVINGCGHWHLLDGETRHAQLWYCGGED